MSNIPLVKYHVSKKAGEVTYKRYLIEIERDGVEAKKFLYSADLKSATDYIDELEKAGKFPEGFDVVFIDLDRGYRYFYSDQIEAIESPNDSIINRAINAAKEGDRVTIDGKTAWGGLGNRSGLYDYANIAISEKWEKSKERFVKKLLSLPPGTLIEVKIFYNIDRNRGNWVTSYAETLKA